MDYGSRTKRSRLTIKKGTTESYKLLLEVPWYTKLGYAWVKVVLSSDEGMRIKYVPVKIE